MTAFAAFWTSLAGLEAVQAALTVAAWTGLTQYSSAFVLMQAYIVGLFMSSAAIVYYLLYVYTGRRGLLAPVLAFFFVGFLTAEYVAATFRLTGIVRETWRGWFGFELNLQGPTYMAGLILAYLPPFAAAGAYAYFLRFAVDAGARYRILLVASSMALYYGGSFVVLLDYAWPGWGAVRQVLVIAAAAGVYAALRPPAWAQRRFGARRLTDLGPAEGAGT